MRVYGVGPPRSGTTMLAKCLSVVRPVEHERIRRLELGADTMRDLVNEAVVRCANDGTSFIYDGKQEVAWYLTFAEPADKTIHLWRPFDEWLDSMLSRCWHAVSAHTGRTCFTSSTAAWNLGSDDPEWVWQTYHRRALSLPDVYTVYPGDIRWEHLLDWLGWEVTGRQIDKMYRIQSARPNKRAVAA